MPDFSARLRSLAVIALHMVKMSKASSRWGLFSLVCFLLKGWSMHEVHTENRFYVQISIEIKIKCARFVLNGFAWFTIQQRENFLGYLAVFVFLLYVNPFVCYGCFYRTRSIVRNRYDNDIRMVLWQKEPYMHETLPFIVLHVCSTINCIHLGWDTQCLACMASCMHSVA